MDQNQACAGDTAGFFFCVEHPQPKTEVIYTKHQYYLVHRRIGAPLCFMAVHNTFHTDATCAAPARCAHSTTTLRNGFSGCDHFRY